MMLYRKRLSLQHLQVVYRNSTSCHAPVCAAADVVVDVVVVCSFEINFDELTLEKKLAQGAFGEVFRCKHRGNVMVAKRLMRHRLEEVSC